MSDLKLDGVGKTFPGGVVALREVSLQVQSGEVLALTGPSGSGKTTLLRLIAGLEAPTAGEVRLDGLLANALPPHRRRVGLVTHRPMLYPHLSVRNNLRFGLPRRWWSRRLPKSDEQRIESLAARLCIRDLLDRRPAELSGGQQQRVALGRALARCPRLLLLDEPFASLDGPLRAELRQELHLLQRHLAATMIVVTHEQDEAVGLADRVAVFEAGRLVQVGSPREVAEHPATGFAAWMMEEASRARPFDANPGLGSSRPRGGASPPE
jgi:multiple sugar transport system ATP-binding protein